MKMVILGGLIVFCVFVFSMVFAVLIASDDREYQEWMDEHWEEDFDSIRKWYEEDNDEFTDD